MFTCKICAEKNNRIADLKDQISYLRNLLNPPRAPEQMMSEPLALQQDMLLDGGGKEETGIPDTILETPEVLAERSAMLSGTY